MKTFQSNSHLKKFATNLRALRLAKGWSQSELGSKVGLGHASISNLETGAQAPNDEVVLKFSRVFCISRESLVNGTIQVKVQVKVKD